jgi:DUF1680 family protein
MAQMQPFALQDVKLTGGPFKNAQDVDLKYILALDPDKLLAPYLIDAGLPLKAQRYGNWRNVRLLMAMGTLAEFHKASCSGTVFTKAISTAVASV